jgi:hypothetical protein
MAKIHLPEGRLTKPLILNRFLLLCAQLAGSALQKYGLESFLSPKAT